MEAKTDRIVHDNRNMNGVTYDTIATERMLDVSTGQLNTLVKAGVLVPCNAPVPGSTKFYRRFTASAIESARGRMAEVLRPSTKPAVDSTDLAGLHLKLDRIEAMVARLDAALNSKA